MKYKSLFIPLLLTVLVSSCAKEAVVVPKEVELDVDIPASPKIHTEDQLTLLESNNPAALVEENASTYGRNSLSKPLPVTFNWVENNDIEQRADSYKLTISENENLSNSLVYTSKINSIDIYNLKINTNYYYKVSSNHHGKYFDSNVQQFDIEDVAPRNIYVDGVENVRDLGGWHIGESKTYKQGMIYRTAQFNYGGLVNSYESAPTKVGKNTLLKELKIKTEIDLRRNISFDDYDEVNGIKTSPLGKSVKYVSYPMVYGNSNIFTREENTHSIKLFFDTLGDESNYPIAFHCVRGTDRTGALAYALGALVGMSQEDLMLDYLFSDLAKIGNAVKASTINGNDFYVKGIANSEGSNLSEKAKNYLMTNVGVTETTLDRIIDILTE